MAVRMAAVAGQFYEADPTACRKHIESLIDEQKIPADLPDKIFAGVVPHAGWVFSGDLAALVLTAIKSRQPVDTFIIYGAVHRTHSSWGMLYDQGQWGTPLGIIDVDEELAQFILSKAADMVRPDPAGHSREHSIEVQIPLIQHLFEDARIVPLMVPPVSTAVDIGKAVGRAIQKTDKNVLCLASTDLTHYGPSYGFTTMGSGPAGLKWAKEENDMHFLNLALSLQGDKVVDSATMYHNACGGGAVAAAIGTAQILGAQKGYLLGHTTSAEVIAAKYGQSSDDAVGYAGIVYG